MNAGAAVVLVEEVPLGQERALRAGLLFGEDGQAEGLVLAIGEGHGLGWRELPELGGLDLPVDSLVPLRDALQALNRSLGQERPIVTHQKEA